MELYRENTDSDYCADCSDKRTGIRYRIDYLHDIKNNLDKFVKLSIYHWNIAVDRFDSIYNKLEEDMEKCDYQNKYHIFQENENVRILNLLDDKSIEIPRWQWDRFDSPLLCESNDFIKLLPCSAFYEDGMKTEPISYEEILESVKYGIV